MVGSFYVLPSGLAWVRQPFSGSCSLKLNLTQPISLREWFFGSTFMMGFQNYNVHNRHNRYTSYDYGYSVLKSLPKNDILFVYGDNDTYPVWAIQETEQFRDDVKVVNFTLASTPWNIDQIKRRTYNAAAVPGVLTHDDYRDGTNDQIYMMKNKIGKGFSQCLKNRELLKQSLRNSENILFRIL